jgi:dihydropteroate synthase
MIVARALCQDRSEDLDLAFARLGLPRPAREYLLEKLPHSQVLLTGLTKVEGRFLRALAEASSAPGREEFPAYVAGDQAKRPGTALLSGRRDQLERAREAAAKEPELRALADALQRVLVVPTQRVLRVGEKVFELGRRTLLMGVVNVTPDSFSDGGKFLEADQAITQGEALVRAGADLLDVGGESSRPGAAPVSPDEELRRVLPVVRRLRESTGVPISIDTTKAAVAEEALAAGASLVNDISGLNADPGVLGVVSRARAKAALCVMHMQGTPQTMQAAPRYQDVVEEVLAFLHGAAGRAVEAGLSPEQVLVDPGIGFGKTAGHNLALLRRLGDLRQLGYPVLVGTSRKSFLGALSGGKPAAERLWATLGSLAAVAALGGADVVRVHDVAEARDALAVADAVRQAAEAGDAFGTPARV